MSKTPNQIFVRKVQTTSLSKYFIMASRKQLKKSVKMITGDLFADCVALSMCQQSNQETLDALMKEVIDLHTDFVTRISHTEPGKAKAFYKNFKEKFTAKVNDLSERIVNA